MTTTTKSPPVHTVRLGRVQVAVWENDTANGVRHSMTFAVGYRDGDGKWHDSQSISRDQGYQVARAIELATDWIYAQGKPQPEADGTVS